MKVTDENGGRDVMALVVELEDGDVPLAAVLAALDKEGLQDPTAIMVGYRGCGSHAVEFTWAKS